MTAEQQGASLNPASFVSGGLLDDVDVTVKSSRYALYDYNGTVQNPVLALKWDLETEDGQASEQYFSAGDTKYFVPSKDGRFAVPVGDKTSLNSNANIGELIGSVVNCGFPADKLDSGDASVFDGMKCHVNRKAQPKRGGLQTGADQSREKTVMIVTKIISFPWDAKKGPGKANKAAAAGVNKAAGNKAAQQAQAAGGDDSELIEVVKGVIAGSEGMTKQAVIQGVFKALAGNTQRSQMVKRLSEAEFLDGGGDGAWVFDGTTLTPLE